MIGLLNISEALSIALHTCVRLAADPGRFHSARSLSKEMGFSPHHFAKVAQQLAHAGILETERGPSSGAKLARPPSAISLLEIYVASGGTPEAKGCLLKREICAGKNCALGKLMARENAKLIRLLRGLTLDGVVRSFKRNRAGKV